METGPAARVQSAQQEMQFAKIKLLSCFLNAEPESRKLDSKTFEELYAMLTGIIYQAPGASQQLPNCLALIARYVVPSRKRTFALGVYLVKFSTLLELVLPTTAEGLQQTDGHVIAEASAQGRLSLLHLVKTVFEFVRQNPQAVDRKKYAAPVLDDLEQEFPDAISPPPGDSSDPTEAALLARHAEGPPSIAIVFAARMSRWLAKLIRLAAPCEGLAVLALHQSVRLILSKWQTERAFSKNVLFVLREVARERYLEWLKWLKVHHPTQYGGLVKLTSEDETGAVQPTLLPEHQDLPAGGPAAHNLPVSAMLPHIRGRNPIDTQLVESSVPKPVVADETIKSAVLELRKDVSELMASDQPHSVPIADDFSDQIIKLNGLGDRFVVQPITGKRQRADDPYYGYTTQTMQLLKRLRTEVPLPKAELPMPNLSTSRFAPPPEEPFPQGPGAPGGRFPGGGRGDLAGGRGDFGGRGGFQGGRGGYQGGRGDFDDRRDDHYGRRGAPGGSAAGRGNWSGGDSGYGGRGRGWGGGGAGGRGRGGWR